FSSANVLRSYTTEQLVALGISWVWMGMEGKDSQYAKLNGADTHELVRTLQSHGIRVLGSSIIGLEEHTPENIDAAIEYAVSHDTEFHQFMLYTPIPGTPLHAKLEAEGALLGTDECCLADTHGQLKFNYRHPHIRDGRETEFIVRAFDRDFEVNGPSVLRVIRTTLAGWKRYRNHPDARIRARFAYEARELGTTHAAALWAARRWYRSDPAIFGRLSRVQKDLYREFGWKARLMGALGGRFLYSKLKQEDRRLRNGWTYEPPASRELNKAAAMAATHA
ncbi:MAG: B12-binding domain-containing radical SAM protein, partial [Phycisphaerae bacterium]|nr:B12-binding domain-containing radical SAM protein [Phycisphaerae bacterium]